MALTVVTVTGTFNQTPAGTASTASLQWQLSDNLFQGGQPVASRRPIPVSVDATGHFSSQLWAVDDTGTEPTGAHWTLSGQVDGVPFSQSYVITKSMAPTVDLSQLTPAGSAAAVYPVNAVQLQGYPVAAAVPVPGQGMVWTGSAWQPGALTALDGGAAGTTYQNYEILDGGNASGS